MVYFTQLKKSKVYDKRKRYVGFLYDLGFVDGLKYAEITNLIYKDDEGNKKKIAWSVVKELKEDNGSIDIFLNVDKKQLVPFFTNQYDVVVGGIIDKQVIDVNGVKIVRVNDVLLGKVEGKFYIIAVCVGKRSFVSRLGLKNKKLLEKFNEHIIPWKSVERLEKEFHDLHLKLQKDKIADLHPEDIADIMEDLSYNERILIFNSLDRRKAAKTIIKADSDVQDSLLKNWKIERVKELLENIPSDQAADILSLMPASKSEKLLSMMGKKTSSGIKKIMDYNPESAGAIMKTDFIAIPENYTAQAAIKLLRKIDISSNRLYHTYVVDKKNKIVGVLSLRRLITSQPGTKVSDFMKKEVIYIHEDTPKEDIAKTMARYDLFVLPVVDRETIIKGIVLADDVITAVIPDKWRKERFMPHRIDNE